jgi:hypothetical protein
MILRQITEIKGFGYWDGGAKDTFDWSITGPVQEDKDGKYVRIGFWDANYWFHVSLGKTQKLTLSYAKKHLKKITKLPCIFEYINEEGDHV